MNIARNTPLKELNTFGIHANAKYFCEISQLEELKSLIQTDEFKTNERLILGGGSNILFTKDFNGIVIKNNIKGIEKIKEDQEHFYIKAYAGEVWHEVVLYCIKNNYAGIENLSLIPGNIGAAPMQNIGAYGVELKDVFKSLEAVNLENGNIETFTNEGCQFGYRTSVFKNELKGQYFIYSVTLRLNKTPKFNTSYGAIQDVLKEQNTPLSIKTISDAVIKIRSSKLPNPKNIGNAGSFFKNPTIPQTQFENLKKDYSNIVGYPLEDGNMKVAAGWLIEQCGWKGKIVGNTGAHKDQALVLVNYGNASGLEIEQLAYEIQNSVDKKFGIEITPEVNII